MDIAKKGELSLRDEYEGAVLGDRRRTVRLCQMAESIGKRPDGSFPEVFSGDDELEAAYRLMRNDAVDHGAMLEPHKRNSAQRAADAGTVIVAHDTTQFNFGQNPREGLGAVGRGKSYGFYGHVSLAIAGDEGRMPLGVVATQLYNRHGKQKARGKKATHREQQTDEANEGRRWVAGVKESAEVLKECPDVIHVMDREADSYAILTELVEQDARFVIRCTYDRNTTGDEYGKIGAALAEAPVLEGTREVKLSRRGRSPLPSYRKRHPPRDARLAMLAVSAIATTIVRPDSANQRPEHTLPLHLVRVMELEPPPDQTAVEWWLWTNEPIDTPEQIWAVVDIYRARWIIEEYFKALKTGCAYEARQFESKDNLCRVLALLMPVAWWLLALRTISRTEPEQPATTLLSRSQLHCLRAALRKLKVRLPPAPSIRDALLGIARLGGHIPRNGEPGWIVLHRGMEKLLLLHEGYQLARGKRGKM